MVGSYETVEQEDDDDDMPDDADVVHQSNPLRMQVPNGTTDGRNRKLLSREKVEEMVSIEHQNFLKIKRVCRF